MGRSPEEPTIDRTGAAEDQSPADKRANGCNHKVSVDLESIPGGMLIAMQTHAAHEWLTITTS